MALLPLFGVLILIALVHLGRAQTARGDRRAGEHRDDHLRVHHLHRRAVARYDVLRRGADGAVAIDV